VLAFGSLLTKEVERGPGTPSPRDARGLSHEHGGVAGIGADMLDTILGLMALLGLITLDGGAWSLFKIFQETRLLFLLDEG
jgi:hypothetical protein